MLICSFNSEHEIKRAMQNIGVDPYGIKIMQPKAQFFAIHLKTISFIWANILKQEMLSVGAEVSINANISRFKSGTSNVLLMGTIKHFEIIYLKLAKDPFGLKELAENIKSAISNAQLNSFELSLPIQN